MDIPTSATPPAGLPLGGDDEKDREDDLLSPQQRPLSGPGTSRQTRRLQLRNAGFQGLAVAPRKVTPTSQPDDLWSSSPSHSPNFAHSSSDAENVSPGSGLRSCHAAKPRSRDRGLGLHELASLPPLSAPRQRPRDVTAVRHAPPSGGDLVPPPRLDRLHSDDINSPPAVPKSALRLRAVRARGKAAQSRRSISAEARKYVEHLEAELSAAHSQLSAVATPAAAQREQSSRLRQMSTETQQLQAELAAWQAQYEARVRADVQRHVGQTEGALRARIRSLESAAEEAQGRAEELEAQLGATTQNLDAVEVANVNLEKRLELLSELLAASPVKIDLHADNTPLRRPPLGKVRPKSMLPILPSSYTFLDRQQHSQNPPSSPPAHATHLPKFPKRMSLSQVTLSPEDPCSSDAESVLSLSAHSGAAASTADNNSNWWHSHAPRPSRTGMRRMRRFGGGTAAPKPLILPATNHPPQMMPASAPALERGEMGSVFSFEHPLARDGLVSPGSPSFGRRRAQTSAAAEELHGSGSESRPLSIASAFLEAREYPDAEDDAVDDDDDEPIPDAPMAAEGRTYELASSPPSAQSDATTRDFSSLGSAAGANVIKGRNLLEELAAARTPEGSSSSAPTPAGGASASSSLRIQSTSNRGPSSSRRVSTASPTAVSLVRSPSPPRSAAAPPSSLGGIATTDTSSLSSARARLYSLFNELRYPHLALARHVIHAAHHSMRLHAPGTGVGGVGTSPMMHIQWWLVGLVWGPMARRNSLLGAPPAAGHCPVEGCCGGTTAATTAAGFSPRPSPASRGVLLGSTPARPGGRIVEDEAAYDSDDDGDDDHEDDCDAPSPPTVPPAADPALSHGQFYLTPPPPARRTTTGTRRRRASKVKKRGSPGAGLGVLAGPRNNLPTTPHHHPKQGATTPADLAAMRTCANHHHPPCCHTHHSLHHAPPSPQGNTHSPWLWLRFSITLAVAVGAAFRYGPGSLLPPSSSGEGEDPSGHRHAGSVASAASGTAPGTAYCGACGRGGTGMAQAQARAQAQGPPQAVPAAVRPRPPRSSLDKVSRRMAMAGRDVFGSP